MSFFDDESDPFDDIVREFFGERKPRTRSAGNVVRGEKEERIVDYIEEKDYVYFVFEIPGYSKEDIEVELNDNILEVNASKKKLENVQDYLTSKLKKGAYFKKTIPEKIKVKNFEWTFNNGILEVKLKRK